jgi:anti-anti-sigma regulatory factor
MLRISIEENVEVLEMKLEGRIAGPWAAELSRVWVETAPRLASRKLVLDLSSVTYADSGGTELLGQIYA